MLVDAPEGYAHLWRKSLAFLDLLAAEEDDGNGSDAALPSPSGRRVDYVMHADDDSFVRLDLLLPLLRGAPRERFYWG